MSGAPQLVHLEMDEKDKEQLQELQQSMAQAQQELAMLRSKMQMREGERRRADLTLQEVSDLPESARAYKQVGKMFLMHPVPDLKCGARTPPEPTHAPTHCPRRHLYLCCVTLLRLSHRPHSRAGKV